MIARLNSDIESLNPIATCQHGFTEMDSNMRTIQPKGTDGSTGLPLLTTALLHGSRTSTDLNEGSRVFALNLDVSLCKS